MKRIIFILILTTFSVISYSQKNFSCDSIVLDNDENIRLATPCVLIAANYVLSLPIHGNDKTYHTYRTFILSWIDKTPDYTFSLNSKIMELCKEEENILLFGVYTTCMAKSALEVTTEVNKNALKIFVDYIKEPKNKVSQTSKIKKLIKDFENNKIDKYIEE